MNILPIFAGAFRLLMKVAPHRENMDKMATVQEHKGRW